MTDESAETPTSLPRISVETLKEVVEHLASMERAPCSSGERRAAEWIFDRLQSTGARDVRIEEEPAWGPFPPTVTGLGVLGMTGALLTLRGRRLKGAVAAAVALAGLADEIQNGPRVVRRLVRRPKKTTNVVAEVGDQKAERTLVLLAHHDAAQTGFVFDQKWAKWLYKR